MQFAKLYYLLTYLEENFHTLFFGVPNINQNRKTKFVIWLFSIYTGRYYIFIQLIIYIFKYAVTMLWYFSIFPTHSPQICPSYSKITLDWVNYSKIENYFLSNCTALQTYYDSGIKGRSSSSWVPKVSICWFNITWLPD